MTLPEKDSINTLREKSLHAELKTWYAQPGDRLEAEVDSWIVDILRDDLLIEIQTRNLSALKPKLSVLLTNHPVRVVYPIPQRRWIVKVTQDGKTEISRRRSPKRGTEAHLFAELVYVHQFMHHPNFTLEILLIHDEEIRCDDGKGSWRRKGWSIIDRRLLEIRAQSVYEQPEDFLSLLPVDLPKVFTTADLAACLHERRAIAQKMAYCLKHMDLIEVVGKRGNALLYTTTGDVQ